MPAGEFVLWMAYAAADGLPTNRLEAVVANAGAYVGATMGGKLAAKDLLPRRPVPLEVQMKMHKAQQVAKQRKVNP